MINQSSLFSLEVKLGDRVTLAKNIKDETLCLVKVDNSLTDLTVINTQLIAYGYKVLSYCSIGELSVLDTKNEIMFCINQFDKIVSVIPKNKYVCFKINMMAFDTRGNIFSFENVALSWDFTSIRSIKPFIQQIHKILGVY